MQCVGMTGPLVAQAVGLNLLCLLPGRASPTAHLNDKWEGTRRSESEARGAEVGGSDSHNFADSPLIQPRFVRHPWNYLLRPKP
jgi:hypothetical protein